MPSFRVKALAVLASMADMVVGPRHPSGVKSLLSWNLRMAVMVASSILPFTL